MTTDDNLTDTLRQKIEELDLERRLGEAVRAAEQAMLVALDALGGYAREHEDDVREWLDKAGAAIDQRTDGRYADQVAQLKDQVLRGVSALADRA